MSAPLPLLIVLIAALIGAAFLSITFRRLSRPAAVGAALGAGAGAVGALLLTAPLRFCTFEAGRTTLDFAAGIVLIVAGMAAVLLPVRTLVQRRYSRQLAITAPQSASGQFKGTLLPLAFLAPTLIVLLLFLYYPFLDTFSLSTLLARLGAPRSKFVCLDNFVGPSGLLTDRDFAQSLMVTVFIAAMIVIVGLVISLFIATMAYQPVKGAAIYRVLLVWPYAVSPAVTGVIFFLMFSSVSGVINYFLNMLFHISPGWLSDPTLARWTIILASVWKTLGYNILFYIAGLQNVPKDLNEAASIDGANAWQRYLHVTLPMLSPITFFLIITNISYAFFDLFGTIDILTGGGPVKSTSVMIYNIYVTGLQNRDLGKAAAQSVILFVIVIVLTVYQFRSTGRRVQYGA